MMKIRLSDKRKISDPALIAAAIQFAKQAKTFWDQINANSMAQEQQRYEALIVAIRNGLDGPFMGKTLTAAELQFGAKAVAEEFLSAAQGVPQGTDVGDRRVKARYRRAYSALAEEFAMKTSGGRPAPLNPNDPFETSLKLDAPIFYLGGAAIITKLLGIW